MGEIKFLFGYDIDALYDIWDSTFGKREADMERTQMDGSEGEYNIDEVFCAEEDGKLIGVVHTTMPVDDGRIAGVGGVCTLPEARGRGVAKKLMENAMARLRERGVHTAFLGTGNPVAAGVYSRYGFSFLSGAHVMASQIADGESILDSYKKERENINIVLGTPGFRIPLIPVINFSEETMIADINAGIIGRGTGDQSSCMSLYPKYERVRTMGGEFFGAVDGDKILGAVASVLPTEFGARMDFCITDGFASSLSSLISEAEKTFGKVYFEIANEDTAKRELLTALGFSPMEDTAYAFSEEINIPAKIWKR